MKPRETARVLALEAVAEAARVVVRSADALRGDEWDEGRAAFFRALGALEARLAILDGKGGAS